MDVKINNASVDIDVMDLLAVLRHPPAMAVIVAEVKKHLEEDERLRSQRNVDRSADTRARRYA